MRLATGEEMGVEDVEELRQGERGARLVGDAEALGATASRATVYAWAWFGRGSCATSQMQAKQRLSADKPRL